MRKCIIAASFVSLASAHSWMTAPKAHNSRGGRGNLVGPCDAYKGSGASGSNVVAGQRINTAWPPMGHSGGHIRVSIAPEVDGAGTGADKTAFNSGVVETMCYGGGNCGTCIKGGKPYNKPITIPTNLADGTYTIQFWMYGTGNGLPEYYSCSKIKVTGGDESLSCPVAEAPFEKCWACPTCTPSKFADVTASTPGQFCYELPAGSSKCWIRQPSGCDGKHAHLIPKEEGDWFHDWYGNGKDEESCAKRVDAFNSYCKRTDVEASWTLDPAATATGTGADATVEQHDDSTGVEKTCMAEHTAKAGDTLLGIANAYGVTDPELVAEATGFEDDEYCGTFRLAACPSGCDMRGPDCAVDDPCTCSGDKQCRGYQKECPALPGHQYFVPLVGDQCVGELTSDASCTTASAALAVGVAAAAVLIAA